jgi:hypothetical protein
LLTAAEADVGLGDIQAPELASPQEPQHERAWDAERRQSVSGAAGLDPVNLVLNSAVDDDAPAGRR